jgi:FAD/FMN-containing dehydrogenase
MRSRKCPSIWDSCKNRRECAGAFDIPYSRFCADYCQAAVNFARDHDLRLAIKASGHDFLGRSTAKNSLLIATQSLQTTKVGNHSLGSAVTVGSGVPFKVLYQALKKEEKIFVGGFAATVAPAGGFFQGAGHSALSPTFGLLADNTLGMHLIP